MNTCSNLEVWIHAFLSSALSRHEWRSFTLRPFCSQWRTCCRHEWRSVTLRPFCSQWRTCWGLDWPQCQSRPCGGVKAKETGQDCLFIYLFVYSLFNDDLCYFYKGKKGKVTAVHTMKACRGSRGIPPLILDLGTGPRWTVNLALRAFFPRQRTPVPWMWGWVGSRARLDVLE